MAVKPELPSLADWMAAASAAVDALGQLTDDEINEAARRAGFDADALDLDLGTCAACDMPAGMMSVPIVSLAFDFPLSGSLVIDAGLASEETVQYTKRDATIFKLVAPLTHDHLVGCTVQLVEPNGDLDNGV